MIIGNKPLDKKEDKQDQNPFLNAFEAWGDRWLRIFEFLGGIYGLIFDVLVWIYRSVFTNKVRFSKAATVSQIVRIGARSIGIVCLVCGCIGLILAIQMHL